eukprot:jgi/Botrbrau1/305/Bobra.0022s0271.1
MFVLYICYMCSSLERAKVCVLTLMCKGGPLCDASSYIIFLWVLLCFGSCLCSLGRGFTLLQPFAVWFLLPPPCLCILMSQTLGALRG